MALLVMWLVYAAFGVIVFSLIFLWAVRAGQFSDQQRARYLALDGAENHHCAPHDEGGDEQAHGPAGAVADQRGDSGDCASGDGG